MPTILEHQDFSRVPKNFGQKWKFQTFIIFVGSLKFSKLPKYFPASGKKFSWIFLSIRLFQVTKFLSRNEFFSTHITWPKLSGSKKIPKLPKCSWTFWKRFLRNSPEYLFFGQHEKFIISHKLPKHLNVNHST